MEKAAVCGGLSDRFQLSARDGRPAPLYLLDQLPLVEQVVARVYGPIVDEDLVVEVG